MTHQSITFRHMGKRVDIRYTPTTEHVSWFVYGIGMPHREIADYWSVTLLDVISATIDAYLDDENAAIWRSADDAWYDAQVKIDQAW